jgi:hypothetical protein
MATNGKMPAKTMEGLKRYGKATKTADIAEDLQDKDVDDPQALAAWVRKKALGAAEFAKHQKRK